MNKSDISNEIAKILPDKKEAKFIVDKVFEIMSDALNNDEKVSISGFGTFTSKIVSAREYRNPKTGEPVTVAPRKTVKFKLSKNVF